MSVCHLPTITIIIFTILISIESSVQSNEAGSERLVLNEIGYTTEAANSRLTHEKRLRQRDNCDCGRHGNCSIVGGKKICTCDKGYVSVADLFFGRTCTYCNCGEGEDYCTATTTKYGFEEKICYCKDGYDLRFGSCTKCDCGSNGKCTYVNDQKTCLCDKGYILADALFDRTCKQCDCGSNGKCSFVNDQKTCSCDEGYMPAGVLPDQTCKLCRCDVHRKCHFDLSGNKICTCDIGYATQNGKCIDIDECLNTTACPSTSTLCVNTLGSYECICKVGYQKISIIGEKSITKIYGCEDINECLRTTLCFLDSTACINTPGSYRCQCKKGYTQGLSLNSCDPIIGMAAWQIAVTVIGVFILIILISLGIVIWFRKIGRNRK